MVQVLAWWHPLRKLGINLHYKSNGVIEKKMQTG